MADHTPESLNIPSIDWYWKMRESFANDQLHHGLPDSRRSYIADQIISPVFELKSSLPELKILGSHIKDFIMRDDVLPAFKKHMQSTTSKDVSKKAS